MPNNKIRQALSFLSKSFTPVPFCLHSLKKKKGGTWCHTAWQVTWDLGRQNWQNGLSIKFNLKILCLVCSTWWAHQQRGVPAVNELTRHNVLVSTAAECSIFRLKTTADVRLGEQWWISREGLLGDVLQYFHIFSLAVEGSRFQLLEYRLINNMRVCCCVGTVLHLP